MKKLIYILIALILMIAGVLVVSVMLPQPNVTATGNLFFQDEVSITLSAVYPEGYYLNAGALDRLYIEHDSMHLFLGKKVQACGKLKTVTGADGLTFPCIVAIRLTEIATVAQ